MHIPVYHMEAGNRCFDENVPEETNRRIVDHVADLNLVYKEHAPRNLLAEGIEPPRITLSGSPMPEVLGYYRSQLDDGSALTAAIGLGWDRLAISLAAVAPLATVLSGSSPLRVSFVGKTETYQLMG
jgi:UDP-N-acetylglucosamine 2-epimerase